jgi:hypothetical protein
LRPRLLSAAADGEPCSGPRGRCLPRHPEPGETMREAFRTAGLDVEWPGPSAARALSQPVPMGPSAKRSRSSSRGPQPSAASPAANDKPVAGVVSV